MNKAVIMKKIINKVVKKTKRTKTHADYPFTNPDKVLYPENGITKLDLADYYKKIHQWILPHVTKRPLTLVRCPEGRQKKCFFQKHLNDLSADGLYSINIQDKTGIESCIYIKDEKGLMALVQFAALEIHVWGCHINNMEKPDLVTFDLDPGEEVEWKKVIESAYFVKENLEKIKLTSFVKTTGGKGLHVVVPVRPQYGWDEIEIFAHTFVKYLVSLNPDSYVANMSKAKRKGKIFLDYLRNQRGATVISPYSTRAKNNAPVATPLSWDELSNKTRSDTFNINTVITRLEKVTKDPWKEFFNIKQKLKLPDAR
jgi:bifunctional non-homologous end joining protein LigD